MHMYFFQVQSPFKLLRHHLEVCMHGSALIINCAAGGLIRAVVEL